MLRRLFVGAVSTLLVAGSYLTLSRAQDEAQPPTPVPPVLAGAEITFHLNYSCPSNAVCSLVCLGGAAGGLGGTGGLATAGALGSAGGIRKRWRTRTEYIVMSNNALTLNFSGRVHRPNGFQSTNDPSDWVRPLPANPG